MLVLKLIQSLIKALHSEGTPGQLAAGLALVARPDSVVDPRPLARLVDLSLAVAGGPPPS